MKTIELFAGTRSFSKVAKELGHKTFTTDYKEIDGQDLVADVRSLSANDFPFEPDMLWASPPCEGFSVSVIGRNWTREHEPKTDSARLGLELLENTWRLIEEIKPTWYFIENPRGKMRRMPIMDNAPFRHTIAYCQYGDFRQKPTDIWTNAPWFTPRPMCARGASCHVASPRGSRTGTQGMGSYKEKSRIPADLFREIFEQYERHQDTN
jgi:hypothetical protein